MIKINGVEEIYCLLCGDNQDGVLVSLEDRADLIGGECGNCKKIIV